MRKVSCNRQLSLKAPSISLKTQFQGMLAIWYHDKVVVNLVYFNSFKANTFENNDFVLFCIKLDTHAQRDVQNKCTRALYARTLRQIYFLLI